MATTERSAAPGTVQQAGDERCAHCDSVVPAALVDPDAMRQFCCAGCRTVWDVLHERGLDAYYTVRATAEAGPSPATSTGRSYDELDDPGFQARTCRPAPGGLLSTELYLEGVHCRACVWLVERLPRLAHGLLEVRLDLPRSRAHLAWDPGAISLSAIARLLDSVGYAPHPCRGLLRQEVRRAEDRAMLARIGLAGAVAGNVMAIAFGLYSGMLNGIDPEFQSFFRWASLVITVPSFVWGGAVFYRGAWAALRVRALHLDIPISLGLVAGFAHGVTNTVLGSGDVYFDTVATLVFLLLVGRYLQRRQQRAAADATELLASLAPSSARLIEGGRVRDVPIEALLPGARVEVRAGDTVPADGIVAAGQSSVDVSLLSGESRPVSVAPGDRIHAGTVNLSARLEVHVESTGEDTRVGRLMQLVEDHARRRAPIVALADRISGHFVAAVLVLAGITFAIWFPADPARAIDHAVALLIVTCPCALGLATPLAVSAAIGRAARAGILVKGSDVLEKLTRPGRLWLDKTGTLTSGRLALVRWIGDDDAKPLVGALETLASHPIARALVAALGDAGARVVGGVSTPVDGVSTPVDGVSTPVDGVSTPVDGVSTLGGGVEGRVDGRHVIAGSPVFVAGRIASIPPAVAAAVDTLTEDGLTPVVVAVDGHAVAVAGLGDPVRGDAGEALERVRARGWKLGVLSGDHPRVVAAVARRLGLDAASCHGGVSPEDKALTVTGGVSRGPVVMVGDGVNDAAALAAATVGIAVHGGAEAALASADVFVARPGIAPLADLLDGADRTMRVVRRNLVLSLLYNVLGVALAMTGVLNPLVAAVVMPASSLTVIVSSYRAVTFRAREEARTWR